MAPFACQAEREAADIPEAFQRGAPGRGAHRRQRSQWTARPPASRPWPEADQWPQGHGKLVRRRETPRGPAVGAPGPGIDECARFCIPAPACHDLAMQVSATAMPMPHPLCIGYGAVFQELRQGSW